LADTERLTQAVTTDVMRMSSIPRDISSHMRRLETTPSL